MLACVFFGFLQLGLQPNKPIIWETPMKTLDAINSVTKEETKASITNAISELVAGSNREDISRRVEETYERLLNGAAVISHVPALTAGFVRRSVVSSLRRQSAVQSAAVRAPMALASRAERKPS